MSNVRNLSFGFFAVFLAAITGPASAGIVKNLEFNVDGVLPSAESSISLYNNTGHSESTLFAVAGGLLEQRTLAVNGNASYSFPNASTTGGGIDPAQSFTLEARVKIDGIAGLGGAFFQLLNGANRYSVFFSPGNVGVLYNNGGSAAWYHEALDLSQFHTYRVENAGGTAAFDFFIDDVLTFSSTAISYSGYNGFNFGDGITDSGVGADADWDFVRFSQPAAEIDVPTPGALALLGFGLVGLGAIRRKHAA